MIKALICFRAASLVLARALRMDVAPSQSSSSFARSAAEERADLDADEEVRGISRGDGDAAGGPALQKPAVVRGVGVADSRQRSALQGQQRFSPLHSSKLILKEYWDNRQRGNRSVGSPFEKQPTTALSALLAERDKKTRSLTSSPFEQTSRDALRLPSGLIGNPFEHQATTN